MDGQGKLLDLNQASLDLIHVNHEDVIGETFWECAWWRCLPESVEKIKAAIHLAVSAQSASQFDVEYCSITKAGEEEIRWSQIRIFPSPIEGNETGQNETIVAIQGHDVTEKKEAQLELAGERHKLEAIFQQTPAAMAFWKGEDLVFEKVNPAYQEIFGERVLLGKPLLEAVPELKDQPFYELMLNVLRTGEPFAAQEMPADIAKSDGGPLEKVYFDFVYTQVVDALGKPYGVYDHAIDVTERVNNRAELEESRKELERNVDHLRQEREVRENLYAALTHDLRTPLMVVQSSAEMLLMNCSEPEAHSIAKTILNNIKRSEEMIQDILDAGNIKAGQMIPLNKTLCELGEIARETIADLKLVHGDRINLRCEQEVRGYWDRKALRRAIENFVTNAVKYGDPNRPVTVAVEQEERVAKVSIHNHGNPIPKNDQAYIFEPFRRSKKLQSTSKGWGLGLTLVWGIAKAHGGSVAVESSAKTGTTFSVSLPVDER